MLKHLQKFFGDTPAQAALVAEQPKEEVVMTTDVTQPSGASASASVDVAALQSAIASLTEQLAASNAQVAELSAFAATAKEFKAAQELAAAQAKVAARTAKLVEAVGTEQAENPSLQAAVAAMDDAAFDAVVTAMSFKSKTEATTTAFKEVGVEGTADASKLATEAQGNRVMDYLKTIAKENQA